MLNLILSCALAAVTLKVGDPAPAFTVEDAEGQSHALAEMLKTGPVVVAFFPKAFTSGCTRELTAYQGKASVLTERKATLLAVSGDDAATLRRFKAELKAPYLFVPDDKAQLMEAYGVRAWPLKIAKRVTFVIGGNGKITRIDAGNDAIDVNNALNQLN